MFQVAAQNRFQVPHKCRYFQVAALRKKNQPPGSVTKKTPKLNRNQNFIYYIENHISTISICCKALFYYRRVKLS